MAEFYDISGWNLRVYDKPQKGSRPNNIYENPDTGDLYYFKLSKASYPSEIWSEIIASKLGQLIGFNVLDYNVGFDGNVLGCVSKSMIDKEKGEVLIHGIDVLSSRIPNYEVTEKPIHSFQQLHTICNTGVLFKGFIERFIELIIFDSIIGNTDRHTENWAFILTAAGRTYHPTIRERQTLWGKIRSYFTVFRSIVTDPMPDFSRLVSFSPIYDSGSCLGREIGMKNQLEDISEIERFLEKENKINVYLKNAKSEIRWEDSKLNLFEIVKQLHQAYPNITQNILDNIFNKATETRINDLVDGVDSNTINQVAHTSLSLQRKQLIKELIKRRIAYLKHQATSG